VPYPDQVADPSLGMPHLFYQVQAVTGRLALVAPAPYNVDKFVLPSWFRPAS
jgi:branched-chain amino acid transport system substrate-binding protein